jgi:hypothetical protein
LTSLDQLGNPVGTRSAEVLAALNDFVGGFLAYESRAECILPVADAHADERLAQIYAGYLWLFLESPEGPLKARQYLQRAEAAPASSGEAGLREQLLLDVLRAWIAGDVPAVLRLAEQMSERFPRELFIVKLQQYLEFNRGNSPAMLRAILKVLDANADVAHAHGMAAFAYEQCHLLGEAEAAARRAIALQRKEPWAQHALAHVLLTQGRVEEGTAFLESVRDTWVGLNSFMLTHNWWHLAVFYLARGRTAEALDLFDREVWGVSKSYSQDQIGAVQLLARLEWAGADVGQRWQELAQHIAVRGDDTVEPFLSLLYLYGLARAGHAQADRLLVAVERQAEAAPLHTRETWVENALPAARGLVALARGDHPAARRQLAAALPGLTTIGGSHAQRDLFHQLQLTAERRSGQLLPVQQALELRRQADPDDVPVNRLLAEIYAALGLPALAQQAASRVAAVRARQPSIAA